jgi:hypothetical protein
VTACDAATARVDELIARDRKKLAWRHIGRDDNEENAAADERRERRLNQEEAAALRQPEYAPPGIIDAIIASGTDDSRTDAQIAAILGEEDDRRCCAEYAHLAWTQCPAHFPHNVRTGQLRKPKSDKKERAA